LKYILKNTHTDSYLYFFHSALVWNIVQSAERLTQEDWMTLMASHDMNLTDGYELVPALGLKYQMPLQRTSFSMYKQKARIQCKVCFGKFGFEEILTHRETCKYTKPKRSKKPVKPIKIPGGVVEMDLTPKTLVDIQIHSERGRLKRGYVSCSGCQNRVYISTKYEDTSLGPAYICPDCKAILRPKDAMSYRVGR
jgi:hypothetical protein